MLLDDVARNRVLGWGLCALICASVSGCGSGEKIPPLFPVTGKVTYNGKAVAGATVIFFPPVKSAVKGKKEDAPTLPRRLKGYTDDDGNYSLAWGEDHEEGVPAGTYKVGISAVEFEAGDDDEKEQLNKVPARYGNPATSGFTAIVKEGGENVFDYKLDDSEPGQQ